MATTFPFTITIYFWKRFCAYKTKKALTTHPFITTIYFWKRFSAHKTKKQSQSSNLC